MTAEIAILNKLGVALAADSIITITSHRGEKTYNTSNKLFTLSKLHPVGVLTYGYTDVDTMPVEIIIKEFRETLKRASRPRLLDYSNEFVQFMLSFAPSTNTADKKNFSNIASDHADTIMRRLNHECAERNITLPTGALTPTVDAVLSDVLATLTLT